MPVSATASTMPLVDSSAASYFTRRRCPMMSASSNSTPVKRLQPALEDGRFFVATHAVDAKKTDSACSSQTGQLADIDRS